MYKLINSFNEETKSDFLGGVLKSGNIESIIPLAPANTDYQQFKADLANGVELQDADGNPMTAEQVKTFLEGLK